MPYNNLTADKENMFEKRDFLENCLFSSPGFQSTPKRKTLFVMLLKGTAIKSKVKGKPI